MKINNNEHLEQVKLINWFREAYPILKKCLWAIPNGGMRHIRTAIKLKQEGALSGVSDLFLMVPKNNKHGMFIEMKSKNGKLQDSQKEFMSIAKAMGYEVVVCYSFNEAKTAIENYFNKVV